mmetsp:Transcript_79956/g.138594  ORF Transcript_79956/g.138594 Transcript_79956/m.138594 type:complete len:1218 (-) Transcript_79956:110-3763(-)
MLATPAIVDTLPEVAKEGLQEEASTTEGEDVTASEDSDTDLKAMAEEDHEKQAQTALQYYAGRFGQNLDGEALECKEESATCTVEEKDSEAQLSRKPEEEVLAELDHDMTLKKTAQMVRRKPDGTSKRASAVAMDSTKRVSGRASPQPLMVPKNRALMPTFGYAAGLEEHPPFAKFDIRNSICSKVGGLLHGQVVRDRTGGELVVVGVKEVEGMPRLFFQPKSLKRPATGAFIENSAEALRQRVTPIKGAVEEIRELSPEELDAAEDSDGEEVFLCRHCRLPVGSLCYFANDKKTVPVHGECMAQMLLQEVKDEEAASKEEDAKLKKATREQYEIGWCASEVPNSAAAAQRLGCDTAGGMCCVVFDEAADSVRVAPTLEPAESVNLEYLSLSLQVRLREGREPIFSLDPVMSESGLTKSSMQAKVYSPDWLAGTSVGEVMFQADYHLKELSMGEYSQPVIGMKSCFDYSEMEGADKEWSGREWFIVRKADIALTEDSILVPRVKMGVEAREQVLRGDQLIDVKTTRKHHPLVKYADSFTRCFDLIAERKSVVFHLRELAKASVMAKMLVDGGVKLNGPWFDLAGEVKEFCPMEVPQLWNHRERNKILMNDGNVEMANEDGEELHYCQGLYGGVSFGLEKAAVSMPSVISRGRLSTTTLSARPALASTKLAPAASVAAAGVSMPSMISRGRMASLAARPAVGLSAVTAPSVSAAAARPAVGLSSVTAGLARPATGLASVTAGLAPRPAVSLQTSKMMTVTQTRAPGLMPQRPSVGLSAVTTARPAAGLSAVTTRLAAPSRPAAGLSAVTSRLSVAGAARPSAALSAMPTVATRPAIGLGAPAAGLSAVTGSALGTTARISAMGLSSKLSGPRGVDLNLDQFNLTSPVATEGGAWHADHGVKCATMGNIFWSCLDEDGEGFNNAEKKLLRAVYDPNLSDRREEGEHFMPPDTSYNYVQRLRKLVTEEEECREKRLECFLSRHFSITKPGDLFPSSWKPTVEIANEKVPENSELRACNVKNPSFKFQRMLMTASPTFDKKTEEGIRFRIYNFGNLEVRTTQQPDLSSAEIVGAVFSRERATSIKRTTSNGDCDTMKLAKVTEYIERTNDVHVRGSYLVMESDTGNVFVTEKLANGRATWEVNPEGLEARNALAKEVRSTDITENGITVCSVRRLQALSSESCAASSSNCKRYVQAVYSHAMGAPSGDIWTGFMKTGGVLK